MIHKFAILSGVVLSATCMVLHQPQHPLLLSLQYNDDPNYNFAYEVNDADTGDIKSQHESRRGDTVLGQYSLIQPDGIRRTVDYRSNDHTGFQATVNNHGRAVNQHVQAGNNGNGNQHSNVAQAYQSWPAPSASPSYQAWPTPSAPQSQAWPTPSAPQSQGWPTSSATQSQAWPTPSAPHSSPTPTPVAISRSSFVQSFSHSSAAHNPWA